MGREVLRGRTQKKKEKPRERERERETDAGIKREEEQRVWEHNAGPPRERDGHGRECQEPERDREMQGPRGTEIHGKRSGEIRCEWERVRHQAERTW